MNPAARGRPPLAAVCATLVLGCRMTPANRKAKEETWQRSPDR